jgi:predicted TIM-barrel fold metal-dependent hydrolase
VFLGFPFNFRGTAEEMRKQNDQVLDAVSHSDGRAFGYAYMNPSHPDACLDEINRCVRDGPMIGLKFELGTPECADSPEMDTLIARAGELNAVVMHDTWLGSSGNEVGQSTPMQLANLAHRHPSVTIFCAHLGGNWELGIRAIRDVKNLYGDISGSDSTSGFTEIAVRELGADRVVYGSDIGGRSFASQIAKVIGADIADPTRRLILGGNLRRILQPILKARGMPFVQP